MNAENSDIIKKNKRYQVRWKNTKVNLQDNYGLYLGQLKTKTTNATRSIQ